MQDYIKSIKLYLDEKRYERFTGGIKMGFEDGTPQTFWISTNPEFKSPGIDDHFDLEAKLMMAVSGGFSGTLFFILREGKITDFYCNQTIQGRRLIEFLNQKAGCIVRSVVRR
jgi:hypothetical protein